MCENDYLPRVEYPGQQLLFALHPRDVCKRIGLSWWAAVKLHEFGLIKFDPETTPNLTEGQSAELLFVGHLVVGNCSPDMLAVLLKPLSLPLSYEHSKIYYSWVKKRWCAIPTLEVDESDVYEWVDAQASGDNVAELRRLSSHIEELLKDKPAEPGAE